MSTVAEKDMVWIGFMDIIPVIGTVKEAVELVLALYEGNKVVIKEKEKAVENTVEESLTTHVKKLTLHDEPHEPAACADEFSGLKNVTEVRMEMITEYVMKGSKRGTKPLSLAEQKEREKTVEKWKEYMLKHMRIIKPNYHYELKEELKRSKRGEHVFNNNILRFHSKVLKTFKENLYPQRCIEQAVKELGKHTLPQNTVIDIRKYMMVYFDQDEFYVNANAVIYGEYCRKLSEGMLAVLNHINPDDVTQNVQENVNNIIDYMNNHELYVDPMVKAKWIANKVTRKNQFETVRQEVAHMYKRDRGVDWCIDFLSQI